MKVEDQVCSLELAKRLKELGVKQESFFGWNLEHARITASGAVENWVGDERACAFTVAELGEMLPYIIKVGREWYFLEVHRTFHGWEVRYALEQSYDAPVIPFSGIWATIEADARAKMLIYLIENGLYEPKQ
jgi:hypothetical protein